MDRTKLGYSIDTEEVVCIIKLQDSCVQLKLQVCHSIDAMVKQGYHVFTFLADFKNREICFWYQSKLPL